MLKNKFVKWGVALVFLVAAVYSLTQNQKSYEQIMQEDREGYLETMLSMEESPIAGIDGFTDFNYYPINEDYNVTADFEEVIGSKGFTIFMTDGSQEQLDMVGTATFELNGEQQKVTVYDEGETLLLPFRDPTNDKGTYGGGRYINIERTNTNKLFIDFNKAHNFYCAYNEAFVCPVPPQENTLTVAVEAGEKVLK
ncbi:DUF1684 domain-containing protein [Jiulongibacter sediminis]|uniref:DUF1684 domain-containing protein n=1 Tax=Jiulongibacter sediminis TaxID=1605367 RepID=UPI0006DD26A8|nr:DUF1684 domain-containing protein [Jiulongibacter sediminis]